MGCSCTSHCGKSTEEFTELDNSDNPRIKIKEMFTNDQKLLNSLIKLQSLYRGIKVREKFKPNEQTNKNPQEIVIKEDELTTLLNTYPPLNDNITVELRSPIEYPNHKTKYYGEWDIAKNIRHGRGILAWTEGSKYIGYWVNDKANIKGKLIHNDGDIYEGEWINDKPNGKGTYIHKDGTIYEGEWKNDKQDGKGKEKWIDGTWYEGDYKEGKKHGKGKFFWADGSSYEGDFENNIIKY